MSSPKKKSPRPGEKVNPQKQPKIVEQPDSYYKQNPVWLFKLGDFQHEKWGLHKIEHREFLMALGNLEGQTWGEIILATCGKKNGTRNHNISVQRFIRDAQKRLDELGIREDELFSLRIASRKRIWGILRDGKLQIIWYDREHEICPSLPK